MRLLTWNEHDELVLIEAVDHQIPPYSILSHTWGDGEVTFTDLQAGRARDKIGYKKLRFCGEQARKDKINYFWVDTCCIDKRSSNELSEAINSMYRWYRDSGKCYVYLSDVSADQNGHRSGTTSMWESDLRKSRWFTRGWTLQELLAPKVVEFFSRDGVFLGTKMDLAEQIHEITTLPLAALYGTPPAQFPIAERWRWSHGRQTSRKEDKAYCLLGIFDVFLPLIYSEGDHAFHRLEKAVAERAGVSVYTPVNKDPTIPSHATCSRSALTEHVGIDGGHEERAPKRRRIDQPETDNTQIYRQPIQDSRNDGEVDFDSLLKSLLFARIDFRVNNVKKALLSTCQWLFQHPQFQAWRNSSDSDQHASFLWIKGKPGCGKSTLMKAALEWTRKQMSKKRDRDTIVSYFFNARASASLEKSSLGLYRTVVYHLLSSQSSLRTLFAERFAFKHPGQSEENWTKEELQEFLNDAVESKESFNLCLFVDALDEAEHEDDVRDMIRFFIQLSDRVLAAGSPCRLQVCLSSRHYPHISVGRGLSFVVEEQPEHGQDIKAYIREQLTCLDSPGLDDLRSEILDKSARIFLWVVLVVEILNKLDDRGAPLSDMRARLRDIPAGLNELFKDILIKSDHGVETSILFFQWMVFRMRSLEPAELFIAMEYSRSPHDPTWELPSGLAVPQPDRLARFILDCSRGLVEVVETGPQQAAVVQFIHETVREFLQKEDGLASVDPDLAANLPGTSHEILRIACIRRISTTPILQEYEHYCEASHRTNASLDIFRSSMRSKLPFLDYAISHLFDHAEEAQKHDISQQPFLQHQVDTNGLWLEKYRQWWNILERYKSKKIKPGSTLFYFVFNRGYFNLFRILLTISDAFDKAPKTQSNILQLASAEGNLQVVQQLLDVGANVNAQGGRYGSALQAALTNGHERIVQKLLLSGVHNALYEVAARGFENIARNFLDQGADVNAQGGRYGSALQAASWSGHEKTVQTLLDYGADVNAPGGVYGSALQAASWSGRAKTVQTLLDHGADVNVKGGIFENALEAASVKGRDKVVQILIDHGANVNAQGGRYGSALQAASCQGHEKIVQILLDHGADVNASGGVHGSALQAASDKGHEKVVQTLIDHGADVNAQGRPYGSALRAASWNGHEKIVQILRAAGARESTFEGESHNSNSPMSDVGSHSYQSPT